MSLYISLSICSTCFSQLLELQTWIIILLIINCSSTGINYYCMVVGSIISGGTPGLRLFDILSRLEIFCSIYIHWRGNEGCINVIRTDNSWSLYLRVLNVSSAFPKIFIITMSISLAAFLSKSSQFASVESGLFHNVQELSFS